MSRKVPSFGQLLGYIDREAGQEDYTIRHNLFGREHDAVREEFERNADFLQKRKNGTYLFHEILSITRAKGLSPQEQKQRLHEIAREYISARCPDNLVYGGLHQDKDHSYHMHLMISANRAGEVKRQRLSKHQFRDIQVKLEAHVLQTYPELEQKLAIGKRSERGRGKGEAELERRTGQRPKREEILERIGAAYSASQDRDSLLAALGHEGLDLYVRGKTVGVVDLESGKKHRLKTLDLQVADQIELRLAGQDAQAQSEADVEPEAEAEKKPAGEKEKDAREQRQDSEPEAKRDAQRATHDRLGEKTAEERDMGSAPGEPQKVQIVDEGERVVPDPSRVKSSREQGDEQEELSPVQKAWKRGMDEIRETKDEVQRTITGTEPQGRGGRSR